MHPDVTVLNTFPEILPIQQRITQRIPFYMKNPPAKQKICDDAGSPITDVDVLFKELKVT
jgi:hypothetical protein